MVLVLCRMGACGMVMPGLGEQEVPVQIRLALALAVSLLLLPVLAPQLPPEPREAAALLRLLALEIATGLWIGWLARLVVYAVQVAGQVIGLTIGLSSLLTQDPAMGEGGTALGRFLGLGAVALLLASGLYELPLRALAESYTLLPVGGPFGAGAAAETVAEASAGSFALALRLAAPMLLMALLLQMASGLLARIAPQTQVYILAAPALSLAGLGLLALLLPTLFDVWREAARALFALLPGLR
nr:flagellar biosynthetic protein FliR [Roseomonas sp. GC11]